MKCLDCGSEITTTGHICYNLNTGYYVPSGNPIGKPIDIRTEKDILIEILDALKAIEQRIHNLEEE